VPILQDGEAAGNTSDLEVDQHRLGVSVGGDILLNVPLPNSHFHDVPPSDGPLPDVPLSQASPDDSVGL
jgi:hypothetical protein